MAASAGGGQALYASFDRVPEGVARWLAEEDAPKWVHDAKDFQAALLVEGGRLEGVAFDTLLAGYLLDPAEASYPLDELSRQYLGLDVLAEIEGEQSGQLFADPSRRIGGSAAAVALLSPGLSERLERAGQTRLLAGRAVHP